MPIGNDLRQQIILELQARGADAAALLAHALEEVQEAYRKNIQAYEEGDQAAQKTVATFQRLIGVEQNLIQIQNAAAQANEELVQSVDKIDVGYYKLVVTALKFKDSMEKVASASIEAARAADKSAEEFVKIDVGLNKLIVDSFRYVEVLRNQADAQAELDRMSAGAEKRARIEAIAREEREMDKLRSQIDRTTAALEKEAAAEAWLKSQTVSLDAALAGLAAEERTAATATVAHTTAMTEAQAHAMGYASVAEHNMQATRRFGYAALNAGHALQDFTQSGLGAVINNIPLMTTSIIQAFPALEAMSAAFGGPAGVGAAAIAGGVAVDLLYRNWEKFSTYLGMDAVPNIVASTDKVSKALKELDDRKIKTQFDMTEIDRLTEKLRIAKEAKDAVEGLKNVKSKMVQESSRRAKEAIVEYGGGDDYDSSVERVIHAAMGITRPPDTPKIVELQKQLGAAQAQLAADIKAHPNLDVLGDKTFTYRVRDLQARLSAARATQEEKHREEITTRVGRAAEGYSSELGWLTNLVGGNREAFANRGAQPELLDALMNANRPTVALSMAAKATEDFAKKAAKERKDTQEKMAREAARDQEKAADLGTRARDQMTKVMDEGAKIVAREAEQAAVEQIRIDQGLGAAGQAAAAREAREAPAREKRQAEVGYGQEFQSRARKMGVAVPGGQAELAGRQVAGMVGGGAGVDQAMQLVFDRMMKVALQQEATLEALAGIPGPASQALAGIEMRQQQVQRQVQATLGNFNRGRIRKQSLQMPLPAMQ